MQILIKSMIFLIAALIITACSDNEEVINRQILMDDYYDLLSKTDQLFMNHAFVDGNFVNQSFQTEKEVKDLLTGKVTESGIEQIIGAIFDKEEGRLVYKDHYRMYLEKIRVYSTNSNNMNLYYKTVRETILNPGLQLVYQGQLTITTKGKEVQIIGVEVPITFYSQGGSSHKQLFKRYGYPSEDQLSMTFSFIYDNGQYLLDHYEIEAING